MVISTPNGSWEVVPTSVLAGVGLTAACLYLLFRAIIAMIATVDAYSAVPMRPFWSLKSNTKPAARRSLRKSIGHCIAAGILLVIYLDIGDHFGWLKFVER